MLIIFLYLRMSNLINTKQLQFILKLYLLMKNINRESPIKRQTSPNRHLNPRDPSHINQSPPHKSINQTLHSKKYYCHYTNGVYMGGMDCFKKLGYGILLIDSGACAITCHSHDNMINHNIIFRDRSLTSLLVNINKTKSLCFRSGPFIVGLNLTAKDKIEGVGYFIHYSQRKLFKLKFDSNGNLIVKQRVIDSLIVKKVFEQNNLSQLFHQSHVRAMKLQFDLPEQIISLRTENSKVIFGFKKEDQRQSIITGLFFKIFIRDALTDFDVILEQRGYMENAQINYFGERHFNNGNYYIGEFKDGKYNGRGVLIYPKEKKWTYGDYYNGQLQNVIDSDVKNTTNSGCANAIKNVHEYSKTFLEHKIDLRPSQKWLYTILKIVDEKDPYEHESIDYTKKQKQKQSNLNLVQEDFTNRRYQNRTEEAIKDLLSSSKEKEKEQKEQNQSRSRSKMSQSKPAESLKSRIIQQQLKKLSKTKSKQKKGSPNKPLVSVASPRNKEKLQQSKQWDQKKQEGTKQINPITNKKQINQPYIQNKSSSPINGFSKTSSYSPNKSNYSPSKVNQNPKQYFQNYRRSPQKYPNLYSHNRNYQPIRSSTTYQPLVRSNTNPDYILPRVATDLANIYRPNYFDKQSEILPPTTDPLYSSSYPYYPYNYQTYYEPLSSNPDYIHPLEKFPVRRSPYYFKYLDDEQDFNVYNRRLSNQIYRNYYHR